jgi:hypothetical protein
MDRDLKRKNLMSVEQRGTKHASSILEPGVCGLAVLPIFHHNVIFSPYSLFFYLSLLQMGPTLAWHSIPTLELSSFMLQLSTYSRCPDLTPLPLSPNSGSTFAMDKVLSSFLC